MDFVTFTDDDSIGGCLEIADLPGSFLSESVTAIFPEDGVKVSLLVSGNHRGPAPGNPAAPRQSSTSFSSIWPRRGSPTAFRSSSDGAGRQAAASAPSDAPRPALPPRRGGQRALFRPLLVGEPVISSLTPAEDIAALRLAHGPATVRIPSRGRKVLVRPDPTTMAAPRPGAAFTETPASESVEGFLQHLREGELRGEGFRWIAPAGGAGHLPDRLFTCQGYASRARRLADLRRLWRRPSAASWKGATRRSSPPGKIRLPGAGDRQRENFRTRPIPDPAPSGRSFRAR